MAVSGCALMTDACHQGCFTPANHYFLSLPPPPAERRRRRVNILIAPKHAIALRSTRRLVNGLALRSPLPAPGASLRSALPSLNGRELLLIHRARRVIMSIRVDALTSPSDDRCGLSSNYFHHRGRIQLMGGLGPNWITGLLSYAME